MAMSTNSAYFNKGNGFTNWNVNVSFNPYDIPPLLRLGEVGPIHNALYVILVFYFVIVCWPVVSIIEVIRGSDFSLLYFWNSILTALEVSQLISSVHISYGPFTVASSTQRPMPTLWNFIVSGSRSLYSFRQTIYFSVSVSVSGSVNTPLRLNEIHSDDGWPITIIYISSHRYLVGG